MRRDLSLNDFLQIRVRSTPERTALISAKEEVSYRQLHRRTEMLASGLREKGIRGGDRIALLAGNCTEYFEVLLAAARLGAYVVPINWRSTPGEIKSVIALTAPQALIVAAEHLPQVEGLPKEGLSLSALLAPGSYPGFMPFEDLYRKPNLEFHPADERAPLVILPTAAVGGTPRGAILTHRNLITAGLTLITSLALTDQDRHLAALPLFHITSLSMSLAMILVGATNVLSKNFDAAESCRLIDTHRVTLLASFPPVLSMLLEARAESGAPWDSLRYVLGLDSPEVIQRLLTETAAQFWTGFGQTETSGVVTLGSVAKRPGSAGRPVAMAVVDCLRESGARAGVGDAGEIVVQGPLVFSGYWRDPGATAHAFRGGWHHTGDLGKFDSEGYLHYLGRKPEKELIKSGGENIYPAEVEGVLNEMPEVRAVCVFGVPDDRWGEAVKAVIELAPGAHLTSEQVQAEVVGNIASFKKPRQVEFVDSLPRTKSGEIDRPAVKTAYGARE